MDYDVRCIVGDGSVSFQLLIPQYGYLAFLFLLILVRADTSVYPYFLAYVEV